MSIFNTLFGTVKDILSGKKNEVVYKREPQQPVVFGVPETKLPEPQFPTTAGTTRQSNVAPPTTYTPPPVPQKINPLDIIAKGKEQVISQGTFETPKVETGLFESVFSGTGRKEQPSVNFEQKPFRAQAAELLKLSIKEKGLLPGIGNFIFEGFNAKNNPSPEQYVDRLSERVDKLVKIGTPEADAWNIAAQDIYNETKFKSNTGMTMTGGKINVPQADLGIELSQEQKETLLSINTREALFEVLDSPITFGTAKPASIALKGKNLIEAARYDTKATNIVKDFSLLANGKKYTPALAADIKNDAQNLADALVKAGKIKPEGAILTDKPLADLLVKHLDESNSVLQDLERTATPSGKREIAKALGEDVPPVPNVPGAMDIKRPAKPVVDPLKTIAQPKVKPEPVSSANLSTQAKGMTLEQFVESQGTPVYHGTNQDFKVFGEGQEGLSATKMGSAKQAYFFTDNADEAMAYGRNADKTLVANENAFNKKVAELQARQEAAEKLAQRTGKESDWQKSYKLTEELENFYFDEVRDARKTNAKVMKVFLDVKKTKTVDVDGTITSGRVEELVSQAKKEGYDSLILKNVSDNPEGTVDFRSNHTLVFDPKNIKTRSQLEDIWKKANGPQTE